MVRKEGEAQPESHFDFEMRMYRAAKRAIDSNTYDETFKKDLRRARAFRKVVEEQNPQSKSQP